MTLRRYNFRAYPTAGQRQELSRVFGCVRVVFNDVVARRRHDHKEGVPFANVSVLSNLLLTQAKKTPERAWLAEVSNVPLQQSIRDADLAYRQFFNGLSGKRKTRVNPPRFKKRSNRQSARFMSNGFSKLRQTTHGVGFVYLAKIGNIRFNLSRDLPSEPSSVTITHHPDGTYELSFVVDVPVPVTPIATRTIGVDLGLTDLIVIAGDDGVRSKIANPRHTRESANKLARRQQEMARKVKGSANWVKARVKVARAHAKITNQRRDHLHKLSTTMVRENQTIVVEKLNIVGLARAGAKGQRGRGMRKSVHDAGWATFLAMLEYKSTGHGRIFMAVKPAYTSQTCSICGTLDGPKPLNIRAWTCQECHTHLDRDYNAAVNIMVAAGQVETLNARGGNIRRTLASVSGATPQEAGTHRTDLNLSGQAA